jgi:hypothetical protein
MQSVVTVGFLIVLVLPTALYLLTTYQIQAGLMTRHNRVWIELGSPQLRTASLRATSRFLRYCWSRRPRLLADPKISRQIVLWRIASIWACVGYFLLLGILINGAMVRT